MFKKIRTISILILMAFSSQAHSQPDHNEIDFLFEEADAYKSSIEKLRALLGGASRQVPGVLVINDSSNENALTRISLSASQSRSITLVLQNQNLYIVGYILDNVFYRFNDPEFARIVPDNVVRVEDLSISSNYRSLESEASSRESLIFNQQTIENAVYQLSNQYVDFDNRRKALLLFVVAISESARFTEISNFIYNNYYEATPLGGQRSALTNQWASVSRLVAQANSSVVSDEDRYQVSGIRRPLRRNQLNYVIALAQNCGPYHTEVHKSDKVLLGKCGTFDPVIRRNHIYYNGDFFYKAALIGVL